MKNLNSKKPEEPDPSKMFKKLYDIISFLRGPDGCPWDKKQTSKTMRKSIIEEAYECISAINNNDDSNLKEELGDLLLVISMIIRIKEEEKSFTYTEVLNEISEKLIRRHPHVFGTKKLHTAEEVIVSWEKIKTDVEGKRTKQSILEEIPASLPPLEKANTIQKKVAKVGFDWKEVDPVWNKLDEEIFELKHEIQNNNIENIEEELGDILFTIVNIARILKVNPSLALHRTNEKFMDRFQELEKRMIKKGIMLEKAGLDVLDNVWDEIKRDEKR